MVRTANHECIICGTAYYACNECEKIKSWRVVADTVECYQVYLAFIQYREGKMTDEAFAEVLRENGFEGKKVRPDLQEVFDKVLGVQKDTEDCEDALD